MFADRRPITARNTGWAHAVAGYLAGRGVAPNAISVAGMGAAVIAGGLLASTPYTGGVTRRGLWLAAAVLVQLRLLANLLDGMVAEKAGRATPVGELYNEVPDRVSDAAVLIGLGFAAGGSPDLGYLAALGAFATAYVRVLGKAVAGVSVFVGPMAKPQRMAVVTTVGAAAATTPGGWDEAYRLAAVGAGAVAAGSLLTAGRAVRVIATTLREKGP